ncbi:MAG TPA: glucose-6-phosphate isomerase [Clostridiales bacterium]|jgi:glucose-6-phosphate isomerase|nr:glucose-6-phosphate isomerase [Clostridiales bacterium]
MTIKNIGFQFEDARVTAEEIGYFDAALEEADAYLRSGQGPFTGWVDLPRNLDPMIVEKIIETAENLQRKCEVLVVIGIGGSYIGARAAIELLSETTNARASTEGQRRPEIIFAGQNLSGTYHKRLLEKLEGKEVCLLVISKSGTTTEPQAAFALLKEWLRARYGKKEAAGRIYAITDAVKGELRTEADQEGYVSFVVPDDIGGRYSVLSPVGLLPIAAAGIDIAEMLAGAAKQAELLEPAARYAAIRNIMYHRGRIIEVFEYYEPSFRYFGEWLKQLFGESEGKEGKGIFPASLEFTTDLHSMGQFLQEGNPVVFETVLSVAEPPGDVTVPESVGGLLAGLSFNQINQAATDGVAAAHRAAGVPMIRINLPELSASIFGQLVYFFEYACALSGLLLKVDPFNQPGVEYYKAEMRKLLELRQGGHAKWNL